MGRYRPPPGKKSPYITPQGKAELEAELKYLWQDKRPKVTRSVSEAAAQGDRSENAEYIYGKKMLREIDSRIRYLQKRLDELITVERIPDDLSRVFFGAWVRLEDDEGQFLTFRIVGPDEFDPKRNWISLDSPMAQALLKKAIGDEVSVQTPKGRLSYIVDAVSYQGEFES
ncbi:MAG: transcription elongation factor GreB [Gammaproteobacteria bacterium]|nr:transcription elongation factor GreB [Gammaproteobacteria bacterium]